MGYSPWGRKESDTGSDGNESAWNVETWVQSLGWEDPPEKGWEDPPEKGKAIHSSILAWRIPWTV